MLSTDGAARNVQPHTASVTIRSSSAKWGDALHFHTYAIIQISAKMGQMRNCAFQMNQKILPSIQPHQKYTKACHQNS